ncbi:MAG: tetratricopeptide repeat protein [Anaerolineae bacterium]
MRLVGADLEALLKGDRTARSTTSTSPFATSTSAPTPARHNLPNQTTPFVGRTREIAELTEMLGAGNCRLVTLTGPGGVGKTRLALEVGSRFAEQTGAFADGIVLLELAPITMTEGVPAALAEAVGFQFSGGDPKEELLAYLSARRMLLILDNYEHLLESAPLTEEILNAAPNTMIITTSRVRLNLASECLYEVRGLSGPAGDSPLEESEAVQMFVTFAQRAQPGFELKAADRDAAAEITRLVDGLPLGIELAAAWLRMLSPAEIAEELAGNVDFLESQARDLPARQRSMRAAFDYSWNLLSDEQRTAFACLAIFRGGFDRKGARAITDVSLLDLRELVDRSLLRRDPMGRYRIHEVLRQYAEREFDSDPDMARRIRDRHAAHYLDLLDIGKLLFTRPDVFDRVEEEFENIRAAVEHTARTRQADLLLPGFDALTIFFETRSRFMEGEKLFADLAEAFAGYDQLVHARSLVEQGRYLHRLGRVDEAHPITTAAIELLEGLGEKRALGVALLWHSYGLMLQSEYEPARDANLRAITLLEEVNDDVFSLSAQANLGYIYYVMGDYAAARDETEKAYNEGKRLGYEGGLAYSANNLGEAEQALGNYDRALDLYRESNRLFVASRNPRGRAFSMTNIARIQWTRGELEASIGAAQQALTIYQEIGDRRGEADVYNLLGTLYASHAGSRDERAEQHYDRALAIRRAIGEPRNIAATLNNMGTLAF